MARVQVELPSDYLYTAEIQVRVTDLNYGGHVGNDTVLSLIHEARVQYYRHLGFKDEIRFDGSVGQIIADAAIVYKSESFLHDMLEVKIGITEFSKYGFDMVYLLTNKETGKEVARAKTGIVCFDYEKRKVSSVPEILLQKLQKR